MINGTEKGFTYFDPQHRRATLVIIMKLTFYLENYYGNKEWLMDSELPMH